MKDTSLGLRYCFAILIPAVVATSSIACAGHTRQAPPIDLTDRIALAESKIQGNREEIESVERARRVPGFGGLWFDKEGNLHAFLVNLRDSAKLRADMEPVVERRKRYGEGTPRIVFDQGQYDFRELLMWRRALYKVGLIGGVQSLGIRHSLNRVWVGIITPSAKALVAEHARAVGVPEYALRIEVESPLVF